MLLQLDLVTEYYLQDEREKILEELVNLTSERDELKLELSKLKDYDPKVLQQMREFLYLGFPLSSSLYLLSFFN